MPSGVVLTDFPAACVFSVFNPRPDEDLQASNPGAADGSQLISA
jgi:hypothetical protein